MYNINNLTKNKEVVDKINHDIINYFFSRTKQKNYKILKVNIIRVNKNNILLDIYLENYKLPTGKTELNFVINRRSMVLDLTIEKVIIMNRESKINQILNL